MLFVFIYHDSRIVFLLPKAPVLACLFTVEDGRVLTVRGQYLLGQWNTMLLLYSMKFAMMWDYENSRDLILRLVSNHSIEWDSVEIYAIGIDLVTLRCIRVIMKQNDNHFCKEDDDRSSLRSNTPSRKHKPHNHKPNGRSNQTTSREQLHPQI